MYVIKSNVLCGCSEEVENKIEDAEIERTKKKNRGLFTKVGKIEVEKNICGEAVDLQTRVKVKGAHKFKELKGLNLGQTIPNAHKGSIWCMEFSKKGDYLATGGQ
ncbi:hypothetical protein RFI_33349, partial [Reticulomyxa filosa]